MMVPDGGSVRVPNQQHGRPRKGTMSTTRNVVGLWIGQLAALVLYSHGSPNDGKTVVGKDQFGQSVWRVLDYIARLRGYYDGTRRA
jgi:hypothetical protein